jgi:hypothetical protein
MVAAVAPSLWENHSVVTAWFSGGGPFTYHFPVEWKDDEEIFLLIAENCFTTLLALQSFNNFASPRLKSDKTFMLKAVELNPNLFFGASDELQKDFDLLVAALAASNLLYNENSMARRFFEEQVGDLEFVERVRARVRGQLAVHDTYTKVVLPAILLGNKSCPLTILNQELGYKKLIAEFLDVPLGSKLGMARAALLNLPDSDVILQVVQEESDSSTSGAWSTGDSDSEGDH